VDFNPPAVDDDGPGDKETVPLDGKAATLDGEANEAVARKDSDNDEDPDLRCIRVLVTCCPFLFSATRPSLVFVVLFIQ